MFRKVKNSKVRKTTSFLILFCFLFFPSGIYALPEDPETVNGNVNYDYNNPDYNLVVNSEGNSIINWNSFNIAGNERVYFNQAGSVSLNRITGGNPSEILGYLGSNGTVYIVNPNGIFFGANAVVDVAGLVASTLDISNEDFLAGRCTFYGQGGSIVNQGYISAPGGYIALLGSTIENSGTIEANLGSVALASGEAITLNLDPQGLISVVIDEAVAQNLEQKEDAIKNTGTIQAQGGKIILTAKALNGVFDRAINNEGLIIANSLVDKRGEVYLIADGETSLVSNSGTIDVSAIESGVNGGLIELCGGELDFLNGFMDYRSIDAQTGELFLDPWNYKITPGLASFLRWNSWGNVTLRAANDVIFVNNGILDLQFYDAGEYFRIIAGRHILLEYNDEGDLLHSSIQTNGASIELYADGDPGEQWDGHQWVHILPDGVGDIYLSSVNTDFLNSHGGDIILNGVNLSANSIVSAGAGNVYITTTGGVTGPHSNLDIIGNGLNVDSAYFGSLGDSIHTRINFLDINTANDIFITNDNIPGDSLTITNAVSTNGSINIDTNNDLVLGTVTGNGSVYLRTTGGNLTISGTVTSNASGVGLTTDTGSVFATGIGPHMVANGNSFISAALGKITPLGDALNVSIVGDLLLDISNPGSAPTGQTYGNLIGTVSGNLVLLNTSFPSPFNPPGYVYFNGAQIWPLSGGNGGAGVVLTNQQLAQATMATFRNGYTEYLNNVRTVSFDGANPNFYFYHPLTPTDFSAFDKITLDVGAYEFIDGNLNLKNKGGLFPYYQ